MVIINSTQENRRIIKMITIKIKPSNQSVETEDTTKILANMYLQLMQLAYNNNLSVLL